MQPFQYIVENEVQPERLDQFLARQEGLSSRSQIAEWVRLGFVLVNGEPAKPALRLQVGDCVEVAPPPPLPTELVPRETRFDILHEDDDVVVVDKPQGLSVHPGPGHPDDTLLNGLLFKGVRLSSIGGALRPGVVHRLDLGTSGVLVIAKNDPAHRSLAKQFSNHTVERRYRALVWGVPKGVEGTIRSSMGRNPSNRKKFTTLDSGGKHAITHWKRTGGNGEVSVLELRLETGRTHQIRVHMAEAGHPVLGDPLYGRDRTHRLDGALATAIRKLPAQALHAAVLEFTHPKTGTRVRFESAPPAAFGEVEVLVQSA